LLCCGVDLFIHVPVFEGYSTNTETTAGITTQFYLQLLRLSNGTLKILNGQRGDLRRELESISFDGVADQSVFTYDINSEGRTPIWFIDGR
jgi:hypothetical protein